MNALINCHGEKDRRKANELKDLICYCFEYTEEDVRQDYRENGQSTILEKIKQARASGNCQCAAKHPKGR